MSLKITRAADPITVERIKLVIYGQPGAAKTSLAFTADKPLLFDFDGGSYRAANRKDVVRIGQWSEAASVTQDDLEPYNTVVIDTAGRALDMLTTDIIKIDPKKGVGGALSLQGYGVLKARFGAFLNLLNSFGKDVILVAHMEEKQRGDEIIERLDVQGGSKGEIYKSADAMGRLVIEGGQRWLKFSPTDAAFGKNPGQLDPLKVPAADSPDFEGFLGRVIQQTKDRLNAMSEAQTEAVAEQKWFAEALPKITDAAGLNQILGRAAKAGRASKLLVRDRAKALGLTFDETKKEYVAKVAEAA